MCSIICNRTRVTSSSSQFAKLLNMTTKHYRRHFSFIKSIKNDDHLGINLSETTSSGYSTGDSSVKQTSKSKSNSSYCLICLLCIADLNSFVKRLKSFILPKKSKTTTIVSSSNQQQEQQEIDFDHISIWLDRTSQRTYQIQQTHSNELIQFQH